MEINCIKDDYFQGCIFGQPEQYDENLTLLLEPKIWDSFYADFVFMLTPVSVLESTAVCETYRLNRVVSTKIENL
jgi:hypothetical protein